MKDKWNILTIFIKYSYSYHKVFTKTLIKLVIIIDYNNNIQY